MSKFLIALMGVVVSLSLVAAPLSSFPVDAQYGGGDDNGQDDDQDQEETPRERIRRIRRELRELRRRRRELRRELRRQLREQQRQNNGQVLGATEEGDSEDNNQRLWLTILGLALIPAIAAGLIAIFASKKP